MTTDEAKPTNHLKKTLVPIIVILLIVIGGLTWIKSQVARPGGDTSSAKPGELQIGSTIPEFSVQKFGEGVVHSSSLKGKVFLINFWATWCEACMVEMPSIVKLHDQYKDKGFEVIAINVDENPQAVLPGALKRLGINFPVYTDIESKLADLFDVRAIPLTVIIDKNRKILFMENGERNWDGADIRSKMEGWLSG